MSTKNSLSEEGAHEIIATLKVRFEKHMNRHKNIKWEDVASRLLSHPEKLWSLSQMEETGGKPDVISYDTQTGEYTFCDCSAESPSGRRSYCYDEVAFASRKENKPKDSAMNMAKTMGIELITESEYQELQKLGEFDMKTSSWLQSTSEIRKLGGAIFGDRRYGRVFIYHNGAESYYAARGFRGSLRV